MLDEVEASGDPDAYVRGLLDRGERIMGFGHRVYRAEDPRARVLRRTAHELGSPRVEVAEALEQAALAALREKSPDRVLETNVEFWAAVVLDDRRDPAADVPGDVRLRARRRLVGAHRRAAAHRPPDPSVGALRRRAGALAGGSMTLAEAAVQAAELAEQGEERTLAELRAQWDDELEAAARSAGLPRARRSPTGRSGSSASGRRSSCCGAGSRTTSPACRGSALLSLELLSRDHPSVVNGVRPLLHELVTHDDNDAVRRLAVMSLRNGSPQRDTIQILAALADDDEAGRELRDAAAKVAQVLRRKAGPAK